MKLACRRARWRLASRACEARRRTGGGPDSTAPSRGAFSEMFCRPATSSRFMPRLNEGALSAPTRLAASSKFKSRPRPPAPPPRISDIKSLGCWYGFIHTQNDSPYAMTETLRLDLTGLEVAHPKPNSGSDFNFTIGNFDRESAILSFSVYVKLQS